jgi:hypothetical protein
MAQRGTGWPRGRLQWLGGSVVLIGVGLLVGMVLGSVWLGATLGVVISLGWLMAYESWRGRNVGVNDDDNGIEL